MNKKTTYELIITEKLQLLPLPRLEDAIWARVKEQLDVDMLGSDGDGGTPPDAPPGGGWAWSAGLFTVVAALVTGFFLTRDKPKNFSPSATENSQAIPPSSITEKPPDALPTSSGFSASSNQPKRTAGDPAVGTGKPLLPAGDSLMNGVTVTLPAADTFPQTVAVMPPSISIDTMPAKKKRGVTGLTDADYRIVPKKDNE